LKIQSALNFLAIILLLISLVSLAVVLCCFNMELNFLPFLSLFVLSMFFSSAIYFANRNIESKFDIRSIIYCIFISWPLLIVMGSIPLFLIFPDQGFFKILFISTSLSTTTGTWLNDNLIIPNEFYIWQSALQWMGGLLTLLLATTFIEVLFDKSNTESRSFDLSKIKIIFLIYSIMTIIFVSIFYLLGLSLEDSFRLSASSLSTSSSISSSDQSIYIAYNNKILCAMILGMFIGSLSVMLHYKAFTSGISSYLKDKNAKLLLFLAVIIYVIISFFSDLSIYQFSYNYLINKLFIIFSLLTTTGFVPVIDYGEQFASIMLLLTFLAFIGGAASSTTGGIKISRLASLFEYISSELYHLSHPREILPKDRDNKSSNLSLLFVSVILFFSSFFIFSVIFTLLGFDFKSSLLIVVSFITNTGQGILEFNNLYFFPSSAIESIVSIFAMLVGRIETIFIMLLFSKTFWLES